MLVKKEKENCQDRNDKSDAKADGNREDERRQKKEKVHRNESEDEDGNEDEAKIEISRRNEKKQKWRSEDAEEKENRRAITDTKLSAIQKPCDYVVARTGAVEEAAPFWPSASSN